MSVECKEDLPLLRVGTTQSAESWDRVCVLELEHTSVLFLNFRTLDCSTCTSSSSCPLFPPLGFSGLQSCTENYIAGFSGSEFFRICTEPCYRHSGYLIFKWILSHLAYPIWEGGENESRIRCEQCFLGLFEPNGLKIVTVHFP